ncbi:hypothetical protein [Natronomonas gomsonensis]|uniref:DUF7286 family protein n=1 Tax=Natronomonas gomsonensis TaxID=1046043 RepID=UPI0015BE8988|nr:hypothetical protein [Natronomonas gomsonensis]
MNDRARVPFALVGVLLVVSSVTLTATVGHERPVSTPAVDRAMEGVTAESVTELRGAADDAATAAAARPVTRPANTTAGRALNDSQPFRDALRLRLYLRAAARLETVTFRRGDVVATASLPPVNATTDGYREAIERVRLSSTGTDGAALRVEIDGLRLTATRNGEPVSTVERSPSFVVANPALSLHDRTERFERRANAAVTEPGLGRRLTARLYPIAWTRGYAQYGGAPISSVLGTRHVELATNDALLAEQQAAFGTTDPGGERGIAAAGRRVATTDLLSAAGGENAWTDAVLEGADDLGPNPPDERPVGTWRGSPPANPTVEVGVNGSADHAYADVVGIGTPGNVSSLVERAHTVEARVATEVESRGSRREPTSPGSNWRRVATSTDHRVALEEIGSRPPHSTEWSTRNGAVFDAQVTATTTRTWRRGNETTTTEAVSEWSTRIGVSVQARTVPIDGVPTGDLDGVLRDATRRASADALQASDGLRGAARDAATGASSSPSVSTAATTPATVERSTLVEDLRPLRERTRNVTISIPARAVGAGRANPPSKLRSEIRKRRTALRGPNATNARGRTRLAVRAAYLERLDNHLESRADTHNRTNEGITDAISRGIDPNRLDGALAAHRARNRPASEPLVDPAGNLSISVDAAPSYLPTSEVSRDRIDVRGGGSVYPLKTRNVNVFASPHDTVAESVVDRIPFLGTDRVALSTAAGTLAAMDDDVAPAERRALEAEVEAASAYVRGELTAAMVEEGIPEGEAESALRTDTTTASDALLLANGSAIDRAVEAVDTEDRDRLRVRLNRRLEAALRDERGRPRRAPANEAGEVAREAYRKALTDVVANGTQGAAEQARKRALGKRLGALPAGLPIAPVPGYWYATGNAWTVSVGGTYERFTVRANRGDVSTPVTYLRDGRTVRLRHDGESRRLGTAERISFRTETVVVVVVPPGKRGVGDTDGVVDERSPGWPP